MNEFTGLYDIRDGKPEDKNFILATMLRGLYYGEMWYGLVPKQIFMDNYKTIAEELVNSANVKVACLKEDPDVIIGYSLMSNDFQTIHWVFVKSAWRKHGIARTLLPKYPTACTHLSRLGQSLMFKFGDNFIFNPFLKGT